MTNKERKQRQKEKREALGKVRYERTIWAELVVKMDAYLARLTKREQK